MRPRVLTEQYVYFRLAAAVVVTLGTGTVFYHLVEKFSWLDAYYFSVTTLTTVGFGDLAPKTDAGKFFTTLYILIGIGIITRFITIMTRRRGQKLKARHEEKLKSLEELGKTIIK